MDLDQARVERPQRCAERCGVANIGAAEPPEPGRDVTEIDAREDGTVLLAAEDDGLEIRAFGPGGERVGRWPRCGRDQTPHAGGERQPP